jgi:hypothetical protein
VVTDKSAADIWIPTPEELAERAEPSAGVKAAAGRRRRPVRGQMRVRQPATGSGDEKLGEPRER